MSRDSGPAPMSFPRVTWLSAVSLASDLRVGGVSSVPLTSHLLSENRKCKFFMPVLQLCFIYNMLKGVNNQLRGLFESVWRLNDSVLNKRSAESVHSECRSRLFIH